MKVAIIGAGLTGLSAAISLKDYVNVKIFEKNDVGGLASSYCKGYCIEKFYHHCFKRDEELIKLIRRFGLSKKLVWRVAKIGCEVNGKIYPLNTPFEILRYPYLSLYDKIKLAIFTLKSKSRNYEKEDYKSVVEGIREELGENLLDSFFMPLLRSKFGDNYKEVSYAWLLARVAIRSNRKYSGEELGYLKNGFNQLIERMVDEVDVTKKEAKLKKFGGYEVCGEKFDAVIYTGSLNSLDKKIAETIYLPKIKYQSSVCALISLKEKLTNIYWTNITSDLTFGALIEHTNFMDFEDYGEHLIYLASYSTPDGWLFKCDNETLRKMYLKDLKVFGVSEKDVRWIKVFKAKYSSPIYEKGYIKKITDYRTPLKGFYIAGLTSKPNYPERSMNGSIKAGKEVAKVLKSDFKIN